MAATFATSSTVVGLGRSSLSSPSRVSAAAKRTNLTSGAARKLSNLVCASRVSAISRFLKSPVAVRNPLRQVGASGGKFTCSFERDWLRTDLNVIGFGLIGWLAPSSIPAIDGKSLTGLFFESIGAELAHFPSPPPLQSQFWLWLVTWHLGLFLCLTFGQIGFKGRTEDYF
ncbi:hypothetical protein CJ030_MR1G027719 [Morella rubra]|uniref:Photosystem I subunit O n=1 Tax=Morella rubra TaxID=262757 RepID=A0A6A1WPS6_9ROSI|nr:hypothetical protein CJ030_MR1G027719 [Morella rubra]